LRERRGKRARHAAAVAGAALAVGLLWAAPGAAGSEVFCAHGSGAGQCEEAYGVAVEEGGERVYVVDRAGHEVEVFDLSGSFQFAFGGLQLASPSFIAVDNDPASPAYRDVYVVDGYHVARFDRLGAFLGEFGAQGSGPGQLSRANDPVAVAPGGTVVVCDSEAAIPSLEAFEAAGGFLGSATLEGVESNCLNLAAEPGGDFYATFNRSSLGVREFDAAGGALGTLEEGASAYALGSDGAGRVFALQSVGGEPWRVTAWDSAGTMLERFGYGEIATVLRDIAPYGPGGEVTEALFASEGGQAVRFGPPPAGPAIVPQGSLRGVAAEAVGKSEARLEAAIDPEGQATSYHFEYVDEASYAQSGFAAAKRAPASAGEDPTLAAGFGLRDAAMQIGCADPSEEPPPADCLAGETEYRFRVVAENAAGEGNSPQEGPAFTTLPPLEARAVWSTAVGGDSARLWAEVNPLGLAASGRFQYVAEPYFESEGGFGGPHTQTTGAVSFGAGEAPAQASLLVHGLTPGSAYRYRVVVENALVAGLAGPEARLETRPASPLASTARCPNAAYRRGQAAHLPDCRAYEMVSPVDKGGADIIAAINASANRAELDQAARGGGRVSYSAYRAFGDPASAPYASQYLASRGAAGWQNRAISPPRGINILGTSNTLDSEFKAFTAELCGGVALHDTDPPLAAAAPAGFANLYRSELCGAAGYEALTTKAPPAREPNDFLLELQGISADGTTAAYTANDALSANAPATNARLAYAGREGANPKLLCVLPGGAAVGAGGCSVGTSTNVKDDRSAAVASAVSGDGSRIYWSDAPAGQGRLYVRENPFGAGAECSRAGAPCTLAVSAGSEAQFWAAAADGSRAIFSEGELSATAASSTQLFEFDLEAGEARPIAPRVAGVLGASGDASRVYFLSAAALAGKAREGEPNLYLREAGEGAPATTYIGTLGAADGRALTLFAPSAVNVEPIKHLAAVSPDGRRVAFMSSAAPTGYDNTDAASGEPDMELFTYEAGGELFCVSCDPSGARPVGRELLNGDKTTGVWAAGLLPGAQSQLHRPRAISADGRRVFFESTDDLLARDTNGRQDVYEWERAGSRGECEALGAERYLAGAGGCLSLISGGESQADSRFLDASGDGTDVFIATAQSLAPQDPGQVDVYDVRAGGGFPAPAQPPAPCEGEACQSPAPAPGAAAPASSAFHGPGNLVEGPNCGAAGRRAAKLSRRAKRLRRHARIARRNGKGAAARKRGRKAKRLAHRARKQSGKAKRCRRRAGG